LKVKRCNSVGVKIYVDAVINHMTSDWPVGTKATGNSSFDGLRKTYDAVPFSGDDFHGSNSCPTASGKIENYADSNQVGLRIESVCFLT
jgi:alpha-amylase